MYDCNRTVIQIRRTGEKMKRILLALAMTAVLCLSFGQTDLGDDGGRHTAGDGDSYQGTNYLYSHGLFTFTANFVWTDITRRTDAQSAQNVSNVSEMGYYLSDENGKAIGSMVTMQSSEGVGHSVIFSQGDRIGVFMKINGVTVTSTESGLAGTVHYATDLDSDSAGGDQSQYFRLYDQAAAEQNNGAPARYEYYFNGMIASREEGQTLEEFTQLVEEEIALGGGVPSVISSHPAGSNGQPLPGVVMTILLGSAVLASGRRLKGRKKADK